MAVAVSMLRKHSCKAETHFIEFNREQLMISSNSTESATSLTNFTIVCSPYPTLNLRRPSFSSRRCTDLEQSSAAYNICSVTSRLLLSLEDILLRTLLRVITVVVPLPAN